LEHEHEATGKRQKTGKKKQRARRKVQKGSGMAQAEGSSMVFWPCDTFLSLDSCKKKASCKSKQASWQRAVQEGKQNEGLQLGFLAVQKATFGTTGCRRWARSRPSVPWCFTVALRHIPFAKHVQEESQLQEQASKLAASSAGKGAKARRQEKAAAKAKI
jgi:hypothetical protein